MMQRRSLNAPSPGYGGHVGRIVVSFVASAVVATTTVAQLTEVRFPTTQQTQITDCSTPTTLTLPGGATVTFSGGQFIHYEDAFFKGTMYASSSAAGCQHLSTSFTGDVLGHPTTDILVSFSKAAPRLELTAYNLFSQDQALGVVFEPQTRGQGGGSAGNEFLSFQMQTVTWPPPPPFGQSPTVSLAVETFTQQVQPDFTHTPTGWSFGITSLKIPQGQPDIVRFDFDSSSPASDGKVLISKAAWDPAFSSLYQVSAGASALKVRISGTLLDGSTQQPKSGIVYLRVADPPDTAPYRGVDAHDGDNDGSPAHLDGEDQSGVAKVQTDSGGQFNTVLTISPNSNGRYTAGDNYQVMGATDQQMSCGSSCASTRIFTLWKRVYTEQTNMLRRSVFVRLCAARGDTVVAVADGSVFSGITAGEPLVLLHANTAGEGFTTEYNSFDSLISTNGQAFVRLQSPLVSSCGCPNSNTTSLQNTLYLADAIGLQNAGAFSVDDIFTEPLMEDAFVDLQETPEPNATQMPFRNDLQIYEASQLAARWFAHRDANGAFQPNVIHRLAASNARLMAQAGGVPRVQLGYTAHAATPYPWNFSYTLVGRIEQATTQSIVFNAQRYQNIVLGLPTSTIESKTEAHELIHLWESAGGADGAGHCNYNRFQDAKACLMHVPLGQDDGSMADDIVGLHYVNHGADSEYLDIRKAADPLP